MSDTWCCDMMRDNATHKCDQHASAFDCPDTLVSRSDDGVYGLIVHDGGSSFIVITHCPWCGAKLDAEATAEGVPDVYDGGGVGGPCVRCGRKLGYHEHMTARCMRRATGGV